MHSVVLSLQNLNVPTSSFPKRKIHTCQIMDATILLADLNFDSSLRLLYFALIISKD